MLQTYFYIIWTISVFHSKNENTYEVANLNFDEYFLEVTLWYTASLLVITKHWDLIG